MNYLLDANVCIVIMNESSARVTRNHKIASREGSEIYLSSIVLHELWFGVANSSKAYRNRQVLNEFIDGSFITLEFSKEDAEIAGRIRGRLKTKGTPIGAYDVLIAGQALARGFTLVTANTREFARVDGLSLVDWMI